jgi:hypothetical protein
MIWRSVEDVFFTNKRRFFGLILIENIFLKNAKKNINSDIKLFVNQGIKIYAFV